MVWPFGDRAAQKEALRRELRIDALLDRVESGGVSALFGGGGAAGGSDKASALADLVEALFRGLSRPRAAPAQPAEPSEAEE
jgi:hypothetical protein